MNFFNAELIFPPEVMILCIKVWVPRSLVAGDLTLAAVNFHLLLLINFIVKGTGNSHFIQLPT